MSVLEVARLTVRDGYQEAFEADFARAHRYVQAAAGRLDSTLAKSVDSDADYVFVVEWAQLEDHTVRFASSDEFAKFQELIGPHLAGAPAVDHFEKV